MKLKKKIKKYGNTHVIVLTKKELENHKLKSGELVDVEITKSNGNGKNKKGKKK